MPGRDIYGFDAKTDDYFLSNFSPDGFWFMGIWYPTNEHFYQAAKAVYAEDAENIILAVSPGMAKRLGRKVICRSDWDYQKMSVMRLGISLKFARGSELAIRLLNTGEGYLEETNTWGDRYWGVCEGSGHNWLGHLLMEHRGFLKEITK